MPASKALAPSGATYSDNMLPIILQLTNFSNVESLLMPLVIVALLIDSAIISIWYMVGSLLGNMGVKMSARDEFYQLAGTVLITILIMGLLTSFSSMFSDALSSSPLLKPSTVSSLCKNIMATSQLNMLKQDGAFMSGPSSGASTFPGLCNMVDPAQPQTLTTKIDYPLAVTGVIIANLTNQTVNNLNSTFVFDAFIGFLWTLKPTITFCASNPIAWQCIIPGFPNPASIGTFRFIFAFSPYAGLEYIYRSMSTFSAMLTNAYELFVAQLIFVMIFVFVWPYLIFIGLVLRSTPFTRGIGGLVIAAGIGIVLFYPVMYSLEYLSLGTGLSASTYSDIYGYNYVTSIPGKDIVMCPSEGPANTVNPTACAVGSTPTCSGTTPYKPICADPSGNKVGTPACPKFYSNTISPTCNYTVNFFVQPNIKNAAELYGCWPSGSSLSDAEAEDIAFMLIPFYSSVSLIISGITAHFVPYSVPSFYLPSRCPSSAALNTYNAILQSYGMMGITTYILPLLNMFITLSAILGISGLLGGDTSLAGLSKLL